MEQLNSVILRGIIGNARIQNIGDTEMARFSVATDHAYKNRSGEAVIETTWHQVTAFKNDKMPDLSSLVKGAGVEVKGRLRNNRYTDSNGVERTMTEILAHPRSASSAGRFNNPPGSGFSAPACFSAPLRTSSGAVLLLCEERET